MESKKVQLQKGLNWLDAGMPRQKDSLKGGKFPLVMRQEMPQCCLVAIHRSQKASALGPPLGSRARLVDGPNAGLCHPMLMLVGLVPVKCTSGIALCCVFVDFLYISLWR